MQRAHHADYYRLRVDPTGNVAAVHLDEENLLHALYVSLSCSNIETMELPDHIDIIIDGEGKTTGADANPLAMAAALVLGGAFYPGDYIAGPVVFLGFTDDGAHVSLTDAQGSAIARALVVAAA